jgi:hypothetical protein
VSHAWPDFALRQKDTFWLALHGYMTVANHFHVSKLSADPQDYRAMNVSPGL